MSILIYSVWEDEAELLTDTLATKADGITPAGYSLKAWPVEQSNMVMAVTGTAEVGIEWFAYLRTLEGADVGTLDELAPEKLRQIQANLIERHGDIGTSTVYHFGFRAGADELAAYEYTSMDGREFASRRIPAGTFAVKPAPQRFEPVAAESPDEKVTLARRIRDEQDQLITDGARGVRIGGDLIAIRVSNGNIQVARWYRFPDYDELLQHATGVSES